MIYFNERKRMCFDKEKQKEIEMRLQYNLFCAKAARLCIQQMNEQ